VLNQTFLDHAHLIQIKVNTVLPQRQHCAEALHDLIVSVREGLDAGHKHYLKYRSVEQLQEHLEKGNLVFAAVSPQGKLIACALMSDLSDVSTMDFNAEHYGAENLAEGNWAIHTVGVHPDHVGNKLMARLLASIKTFVKEDPTRFSTLISKVADTNRPSRANFKAAGFEELSGGYDAKGYDYTRFALNVSPRLAPELEMDLNTSYVTDLARPVAFGS